MAFSAPLLRGRPRDTQAPAHCPVFAGDGELYTLYEGGSLVSALVLYEEQDRVATLTLNRPEKRNALSPDMLVAMRDYVHQVEAAGTIRKPLLPATILVVCPSARGLRASPSVTSPACLHK